MTDEKVSLEQARNKFLDSILDKVCDYQFRISGRYSNNLFNALYAIHNGRCFVLAVPSQEIKWCHIFCQQAFDIYVDINKSKFATYQELQDFMKDKQDVNGVFYDGVKLHDFKIDEEDLKRLDGED